MIRKPITEDMATRAAVLFRELSRSVGRTLAMQTVLIRVLDETTGDIDPSSHVHDAITRIIDEMARAHGVPGPLLTAPDGTDGSRTMEVCAARREAFYRVKQIHPSPSLVGRIFNRDHSSVITGWRRFESECPDLAAEIRGERAEKARAA